MPEELWIRGRKIEPADVEQIGAWRAAHPQWSRRRLSEELVRRWDWRTWSGQLKDIATREVLNRLEARGLIDLPARQRRGGRQLPKAVRESAQGLLPLVDSPVVGGGLVQLRPLTWRLAQRGQPERERIAGYLQQYHYLGYPDPLGQLHYLVSDCHGRDVACLLFGPAAWKVAQRDRFIGWSAAERQRSLGHVANNSRFLILPEIQVAHLASHILSKTVRRLAADWCQQHGRPLWLIETFVEQDRFTGTCYRAANWQWVGQTQGRTRNDGQRQIQAPIKDLYVLAMASDFRRRLCQG